MRINREALIINTESPLESEHKTVILYDGVCRFCSSSVQFLLRHDRRARFRFAALQSEAGQNLCQVRGLDPDDLDSLILVTPGGVFTRSDAAIQIAVLLGGPWKIVALCRLIPRPLRNWAYGIFARNRYGWFGRRDSCLIPPDEYRQRFLE